MARVSPDGKLNISLEALPIGAVMSMSADCTVIDKEGNVVADTRQERIEKKKSLAELIHRNHATDTLLDSMLNSWHAAFEDPKNELVHLFEIRDALSRKFGHDRTARTQLGIPQKGWSRLGQLANHEALRQGRHRGHHAGKLRDATEEELEEARDIARNMIEAYLASL